MARKADQIKLTMTCGRVCEDPRTGSTHSQVPGKDYLFDPFEALVLVDAHQAEPFDEKAGEQLDAYRAELERAAAAKRRSADAGDSADEGPVTDQAAAAAETPAAAAKPKRSRKPKA